MNSRDVAFSILQRIEKETAFAAPLLDQVSGEVRDQNLVRTIVIGVLRWRLQLDSLVELLSERAIRKLDQRVVQILRIGLFQMMHTSIPSHAAVSETVSLAARHTPRARGFANAVLRRASRTELRSLIPTTDDAPSLAVRYSHPEWMISGWISTYGKERTEAILQANQEFSFGDVLVNTRRWTVEKASAELDLRSVGHETSRLAPGMLRLRASSAGIRDLVSAGMLYMMDEGSAVIPSLIPSHISMILDLAAAPGGKTFVMNMQGRSVISNDASFNRSRMIASSFTRLFEAPPRLVVSDGRQATFRPVPAVLLDAPCSATGTLRKNPEVKWRLKPEDIKGFVALQGELLSAALDMTQEYCVYSTCSLQWEENQGVIATVLNDRQDFELVDPTSSLPEELARWIDCGVLHLTPEAGTDGFVAHLLRRRTRLK